MANNILYISDGDYGTPAGYILPLVQGQYGQSIPLEIRDLAGNVAPLTGYSTITGHKRKGGTVTAIVGTFTLSGTPTVAPQITWVVDEDDTGDYGNFALFLEITNGTIAYTTHPVSLPITKDPAVNATAAPGLVSVTTEQKALLAVISGLTGLVKMAAGTATGIAVQSFMETFLASATALAARANILPSYTGNAGKVFTVNVGETDGAWETPAGGADTAEEVGAANVFNVKSAAYGAVGDGVADDTTAILAAIAAAKAAGGGTVFLPKGTYLISKSLIMPSSVELRGAGYSSKITKAATVKSLLTANASAGATSVTVTDSTGFTIGKAIHIYDTSSFEWLSTQAVITNIAGNVITFDDALDGAVQTSRSAAATTSFPLLRNEGASTDVVVRDLTLDQNANASDPANDFTLAIIHWVGAYRALVENCTLLNACGDAYSDQAQDGTGITPAANLIKTTKNTIRGCKIRTAGRHGVHLGTCIRGGWILDNDILDCPTGFGFFYCAYVTETVAADNRIENCLRGFAGIDERDYDNTIIGNTVKNCLAAGYALEAIGASGGRLIIANNHFITDETVGAGTYTARCYFDAPDSVFEGNIINMAAKTGEALRIGLNADRSTVTGNRIIGTSGAGGTTGVQIDAVDDLRFSDNLVLTFSKAVSVRGAVRMIADGNKLAPSSTCWNFETTASTDCIIKNERTIFATPVTEGVATVRLVYEGIGTNGANDPASAGDWNAASGRRFDGTMVRWNSGGGEKISIFYNGVGWTVLN